MSEAIAEDGLSLDQSIKIQQFKNYLKRKSTKRAVKDVFKQVPQAWEFAVECLTTPGTQDPLSFDIWYAHWSNKWNRLIPQPHRKWAHFALKTYIIEGFYNERSEKK